MRYDLIDYQRTAAVDVLNRLARARRDWHEDRSLSAFALCAITGAGKTVVATAVIEAAIYRSADLDVAQDPRATFLWVTDDPALNRQTRNKMLAASDLLDPKRLVVLDNDFLDRELHAGRVRPAARPGWFSCPASWRDRRTLEAARSPGLASAADPMLGRAGTTAARRARCGPSGKARRQNS